MICDDIAKSGKRRVVQLTSVLDFGTVKRTVVMLRCGLYRDVIRIEGLNHHPTRDIPAARTSGHLCKQLKGALGCAEIRHVQRCIRGHDTHTSHTGEVQPFGDHLGANQDVRFAGSELLNHRRKSIFVAHRVPVHPKQPSVWKEPLELRFNSLCPDAVGENSFTCTAWADVGCPQRIGAVMTKQCFRTIVQRQRHGAVGTHRNVTALPAEEILCKATAIQEDDCLMSSAK